MVNVKFKRAILAVSVVFAMVLTTLFTGGFISASAITDAERVVLTYNENRNVVMAIDETDVSEPMYFKMLKQNGDLSASETLTVMNRIVEVAKAYDALAKTKASVIDGGATAFDVDEVLKAEADALNNELTAYYEGTLRLNSNNYLTYNADATKDFVAEIKSFSKEYALIDAKIALVNEYNALLKVNNATSDGAATNTVGFYDKAADAVNYGLNALTTCVLDGKDALDASSDYAATKDEYIKLLNAVPKNVLEDVYDDYLAISAYERGGLDTSAAPNNDLYNKMGECQKAVENFWNACTDEVKNRYSTIHQYLNNYFESHQEYDGLAESKNSSTLTFKVNNDTVMKINAYVKQGYDSNSTNNKEAKVFAPNASIALYSAKGTTDELNVASLLKDKNEDLGVGYLLRFNVYGGKSASSVFDTDRANKATAGGVIYVIELNLNKYYQQVVSQEKGILGELLGEYLGGVWGTRDNASAIKKAYETLGSTDTDLCYLYKNGDLISFEKINYNPDGGILMLETTAFGNFAIAAVGVDGGVNILSILLAVAILIVLLIIVRVVLSLWKYSVKFNSNGGSEVKKARARKGEYFVMPNNPVRTGYVFTGWYEDPELTKRFLATRIVRRKNLKAYAKWSLELTPDRVNNYYETLRNILASHGALAPDCEIEEGKTKTFAILAKGEKELKLYLAMDEKALEDAGYQVTIAGEDYAETPALLTVDTREAYLVALKLVDKLIENYNLGETEYEEAAKDETEYVLAITAAPIVVEEAAEEEVEEEATEEEVVEEATEEEVVEEAAEEEVVEETAEEEVVEETAEEEVVEETAEEEVVEETAEEEVVEEAAEEEVVEEAAEEEVVEEAIVEEPAQEEVQEEVTEEQLVEYFSTIRNAVCGYALYEMNDKAEDGKMLIKLYKKDDAVYCYMALDAESYGLETVGLGFSDTPALIKVASQEDLEKALLLVEALMIEYGFEKSEEPAPETTYEGKSFGYRIHYVQE